MIRQAIARCVDFVTTHNRITIVVMLLLTAGVAAGIPNLDTSSQASESDEDFSHVTEIQKAEYVSDHYGNDSEDHDTVAMSTVYVRDTDGNVLSKEALLDSLSYQQRVVEDEAVADALVTDEGTVFGLSNVVATQLAGEPDADLETQIEALEDASEDEVAEAVRATLTEESEALRFMPRDYEPGTDASTDRRMIFQFEAAEDVDEDDDENATAVSAPSDAQEVLYEEAGGWDHPELEYFTLGEHAWADANQEWFQNTVELILPIALALILAVLAFTYRDLIDVVIGMVGVVASIIWMFGILGWLGVSAGMVMIVGPVLITGLSIDYGFHVFMRYREQRDPGEGIRQPMFRAVTAVAIAFGLVTITAAIGFLSNLANPLAIIRDMGVGITLGVISAFVVFVTLVPALKVSADGLLERVGFDRRKRALGHGPHLRRVLSSGAVLARRAAPAVIVVALVAGSAGAVAWTALDQESFQEQTEETAEWKQNLPGPLAWEDPEAMEHDRYVQERYHEPNGDGQGEAQLLVEDGVTADGTLDRIEAGVDRGKETGVVFEQPGVNTVVSPLTVIQSVAAEDDEFARTVDDADADGDGVPDTDLEGVYDHLYEVAPDEASQVIERTDGEYRSLLVHLPIDRSDTWDGQATDLRDVAATVEEDSTLTATALDSSTINQAVLAELTAGVLRTLLLALGAVLLGLMIAYYLSEGSASLGAVTALPIALVTGLVVGGMYLFDVPLTLLTSLLMSLVIGIGIDYSIHVSDRFAQELEAGHGVFDALEIAVTGTGGALLGSTLTSAGAFATLLLHPHPQLQSFGALVVLALLTSFLVSVFVLPSLLVVWAKYARETDLEVSETAAASPQD